jgi:hypothetical protein
MKNTQQNVFSCVDTSEVLLPKTQTQQRLFLFLPGFLGHYDFNRNNPGAWAYTIKHYGFVIYGFHSMPVFLQTSMFVRVSVFVTDNRKDTSLFRNLAICRKLRTRKILQYRPMGSVL